MFSSTAMVKAMMTTSSTAATRTGRTRLQLILRRPRPSPRSSLILGHLYDQRVFYRVNNGRESDNNNRNHGGGSDHRTTTPPRTPRKQPTATRTGHINEFKDDGRKSHGGKRGGSYNNNNNRNRNNGYSNGNPATTRRGGRGGSFHYNDYDRTTKATRRQPSPYRTNQKIEDYDDDYQHQRGRSNSTSRSRHGNGRGSGVHHTNDDNHSPPRTRIRMRSEDHEHQQRVRRSNNSRERGSGGSYSHGQITDRTARTPITTTTMGSGRQPTRRTKFEDEYHIGRQLSKFDITPAQRREYINHLKKIKQRKSWDKPPPEEACDIPSPQYEFDGLQQIHEMSYQCNILLEIRDVRLPASTHHPSFTRLAKHRFHLICYTHADMIDAHTRDKVEEYTLQSWPNSRCIFVDTRETSRTKNEFIVHGAQERQEESTSLVKTPYDLVYDSLLRHIDERGGTNAALTVGVANTGKSSLLHALIKTARLRGDIPKNKLLATAVSASSQTSAPKSSKAKRNARRRLNTVKGGIQIQDKPGKTRVITEYLLRETPRAFFVDVPGMTPPSFFFEERPSTWYGMAATNLLPLSKHLEDDDLVQTAICDYVLYCMNRDKNFNYVIKLNMDHPTDNINDVLRAVKKHKRKKSKKTNKRDFDSDDIVSDEDGSYDPEFQLQRCQIFLKLFNTGNFGSVVLDDLSTKYVPFKFKDSHFQNSQQRRSKRVGGDDYDDDDDDNVDFNDYQKW